MRLRPTYTDEFKADAVALMERSERTPPQVARDLGVCITSLRNWYNAQSMAKKKPPKGKRAVMAVERIESLDLPAAFHQDESVEERLTAMTRLCRAAWLATGRPFPPSGRAQRGSPTGEVYVPDHVAS